jgi:hypothetical protein
MEQKMTTEQAMGLLSQVASIYKGTLEEHNSLQIALQTISNELKPKVEELPAKK